MGNNKFIINDQLLSAFLSGETTREEELFLLDAMVKDTTVFEHVNEVSGVWDGSEMFLYEDAFTENNHDIAAIISENDTNLENNFPDNDRFESEIDSIEENSNHELNDNDMEKNVIGQDNLVQQQYNDTCAIKSQQLILNDFGINVTEDQCVKYAYDNGLYHANETGTQMQDIGKVFAAADIPYTQKIDANIFDLTNELAQGHKVIVGVDSSELWNGGIWQSIKEFFLGEQPDHALIVAGIDNTDPNNPMVLITDPGSGETCKPYPLEQFMDAWQDSKCFMVSTDVAPAEFAALQIEHNQPQMYIPEIAGNSYQDFQLFHDMASSMPSILDANYANTMETLFDAYGYYANNDIGFYDLLQMPQYEIFANNIDPNVYEDNYRLTFEDNISNLADNHSDEWNNLYEHYHNSNNIDEFASFIDSQHIYYSDSESNHYNADLANFYEQQANYIDLCQDMNWDINPMDTYVNFF